MQWFDWMTLAIVVGMAVLQGVRAGKVGGMGLPLFEALGLIAAAVAATHLAPPLAQAMNMQVSVVLIALFLALGFGAFLLAKWLFSFTGWSFAAMDGVFGFVFGIAAGWAIAHMVLRILIESQGTNGPVATGLADAPVAREIYWFRSWNWLMNLLFKARFGSREMWNVDKHGV